MFDWERKLDDQHYPLFPISVVADVLSTDPQTIRRLESHGVGVAERSGGNQRRYSRADVAELAQALRLAGDGLSAAAASRIVALEAELAALKRQLGEAEPDQR